MATATGGGGVCVEEVAVKPDEDKEELEEEEEEEDDEDEDSEDTDSEIVEPQLKYKRIQNDLTVILAKDAASCLAVHTKFLALGTHWGVIYILDHCGNNISSRELPAHTTTVNQICIDDNGDYIASCSDDGRVVISGFYSNENNQVINLDRPIKAVAMDPDFYKPGRGKHFVTGDDKLILNEKGFLGRRTFALHQGEGPIRNIKWRSHFIAWANDLGVKVYDMSSKRRITSILRDKPELRPELYRCCLCWKDDRTLLIGWANSIKVCVVKDRQQTDDPELPSRYVAIEAMFTTDYMVCGLAPYGDNLVVLSYDEQDVQQEGGIYVAQRPHLRILEVGMNYGYEITNDALSIRGFQEYRCNDYRLECLADENTYFIVSPKDIVEARQRDEDDHISWLIERQMFEEAMAASLEHGKSLKRHEYQHIGKQYLNFLLSEERYEDAARLCVKILGRNRQMWEEEVFKFAQIHQLKAIALYLPRGEPSLSPAIYEMVLNEYLQTDLLGFQKLVKEWPSELYNIQTLVNAVLDKLDRDHNNAILLQCLGDLYTHERRYDQALGIYLRLKNKDVFEIILKHNLFTAISDKIVMLMEFDKTTAVQMLLDNRDKIPIEKVVQQLEDRPEYLHEYLDLLFKKDPHSGQDFHALQVELYAEFDRPKLLPFLRSSNYYPLQKALDVCQQRSLIPEMVFLLGRMGNTKQALHLITNDLRDVNAAIDFCKEHNDTELWNDLISYSIDKPSFITGLLQNIGTHVDPIVLIQQIRAGMEIPGLRDSLVKILQDYNLQMSLREGCKKILVADCFNLLQKLVRLQHRGVLIDETHVCEACHEKIIANDPRYTSNVALFHCHHTFHEDCLPPHSMDSCLICSAQRRGPGMMS